MPFPGQGMGTNDSLYPDCFAPEVSVWLLLSVPTSAQVCHAFREAPPTLCVAHCVSRCPLVCLMRGLHARFHGLCSPSTQQLGVCSMKERMPRWQECGAAGACPALSLAPVWIPLNLLKSSSKTPCHVPKHFLLTMHYFYNRQTDYVFPDPTAESLFQQ